MKMKTLKALVQMNSAVLPTSVKNHLTIFIVANFILLTCLIGTPVFAAPRTVTNDFFGTGKTNYLSLDFSGDQIRWDILQNPATSPTQTRRVYFGLPDDQIVFGDWDGDLKSDVGVWREGTAENPQSYFYIQPSSNPTTFIGQPWGTIGDFSNSGDFDGDGKDDFTVTRREEGQLVWYILPSGGGNFRRIVWGLADDFEGVANEDFNGDGRADLLVFRINPENGDSTVFVGDAQTGALILAQQWGNENLAGGFYLFGDYVGDSRADLVVNYGVCHTPDCGVEGQWWIKETGSSNYTITHWGIPFDFETGDGDFPNFGDYDGDKKADISVFRPTESTNYTILSSNGQFLFQYWDGSETLPPTGSANQFENALERKTRRISAAALRGYFVHRQENGTYAVKRAADFYK